MYLVIKMRLFSVCCWYYRMKGHSLQRRLLTKRILFFDLMPAKQTSKNN